jgi:hypothetical protein
MFCKFMLFFFLLNCITKTIRVTKGRKYFPQEPQATREPHFGEPRSREWHAYNLTASFRFISIGYL